MEQGVIRVKILILSCNNGGGHNTVARAIAGRFEELGAKADIKDSVAFFSKATSKLMSKGHAMLYRRAPEIMDKGMKHEENKQIKEGKNSGVYKSFALAAPRLYRLLKREAYDAVVCTHVFGALMMTEVRRKYSLDIKCYQISTDYSCVVCLDETDMDGYFIPHADLAEEFISFGLPEDKLIPTGIPVRGRCYSKRTKEEAKRELYLCPERRIILLMGGSMGAGPMEEIALKLSKELPEDCLLVVVCASNDKLRKDLHKKTGRNVRVLAYTKKLDVLMDAAEVMITKPGGLTSTEVAVKGLPTIFIDAVMGCETQNMEFFVEHGYALKASGADEAASLCLSFVKDESLSMAIKKNLQETFPRDATMNVCDKVIKGVEKPE